MDTPRPNIPRIYAAPAGGLLLEFGGQWYDLSAWAAAAGHPADLLGLISAGHLHSDQFKACLPGSEGSNWTEVETPDN
ncbi:MAG: hypothetical protein CMJ86_05385, partial [Planctomycetes bacterium]|nr:hypothetical protein [Planctomycetota bacterium]